MLCDAPLCYTSLFHTIYLVGESKLLCPPGGGARFHLPNAGGPFFPTTYKIVRRVHVGWFQDVIGPCRGTEVRTAVDPPSQMGGFSLLPCPEGLRQSIGPTRGLPSGTCTSKARPKAERGAGAGSHAGTHAPRPRGPDPRASSPEGGVSMEKKLTRNTEHGATHTDKSTWLKQYLVCEYGSQTSKAVLLCSLARAVVFSAVSLV